MTNIHNSIQDSGIIPPSKLTHVSTRSFSAHENHSFVHISCFSFNTQVLIKSIAIDDSLHAPAVHLRCKSGEAPMFTPYTTEPFEFVFDPEYPNPTPDSLLPKFLHPSGLEFQFNLDSTTMDISGDKDGEDWFLLHASTTKDVQDTLVNLRNDSSYYTKFNNIYPVRPEFTVTNNKSQNISCTSDLHWSWRWSPLNGAPVFLGGNKNICTFIKRTSTEYHLVAEFCFWTPAINSKNRKPSINVFNPSNYKLLPGSGLLSPTRSSMPTNPIGDSGILEDNLTASPFNTLNASALEDSTPYSTWDAPDEDNDSYFPGLSLAANEILQNAQSELNNVSNRVFQDDDGPVFRATLMHLEKRVHSFRQDIKKILKLGQEAIDSRKETNRHDKALMEALMAFPSIQSLSASYLKEAVSKINEAEDNILQQRLLLIFDPLRRLYDNNIKVAESKKKQFDQVSDEYYSYLSKYLSARKDRGRRSNFTDAKYHERQKQFELCRFNYYSYINELRGGGKDQEVLSYFTTYAKKHLGIISSLHNSLLSLKPGLDQIQVHISEVEKELSSQRKDMAEKRRQIVQSETKFSDLLLLRPVNEQASENSNTRTDVAVKNKFHGIRDLQFTNRETTAAVGRKREGFLFTSSRNLLGGPGKRDKNLPGQISWHKKWCVLSGGYVHEYNNWKKQLEANFEPVPLQFATARVAYQTSRKFCFEVVTPKLRRQYQATSEEDMLAWIACITNSIESIWNGTSSCDDLRFKPPGEKNTFSPLSQDVTKTELMNRQFLLKLLQENISNCKCADCNSPNPEWCSINFGIVICIECSGIHRSLGTHITKVRSLTLDVVTFTPDLVDLIKKIGNDIANAYWEARLDENEDLDSTGKKWAKPSPTDDRNVKLKYITAKYADRKFLLSQVPASTLDPTLVTSLSENLVANAGSSILHTASCYAGVIQCQIMPTLQSILLGGDPNGLLSLPEDSPLATFFGKKSLITPLHIALFYPSSVNCTDDLDSSESAEYIPYFMAELLVQNGANVNFEIPDKSHTLLHFAALQNNLTVIQYLLVKGAQPTVPTESPDIWPCFLTTDLTCQQLLFEVTFTEAQKLGLDDKLLKKVKPLKPSEDDDVRIDPGEGFPNGSPNSSEEFVPRSLPTNRGILHGVGSKTGSDRAADLGRSISADTRSPASPIKRLSGGWKQQLQQFSNKDNRESNCNQLSSSPASPFLKKSVFRRSGQPADLPLSTSTQPVGIPIRQPKPNHCNEPSQSIPNNYRPPQISSKPFQDIRDRSPQNSPPSSPHGGSPMSSPLAESEHSDAWQEGMSRTKDTGVASQESEPINNFAIRRSLKPTRTATIMDAFRKLSNMP